MITQVKLVSIPVKDQDRALAFYTEALGFEVVVDQPFGGGKRWLELKIPGDGGAHVVLFTPGVQEDRIGSVSNIVFASEDVERTYEELRGRGVEFAQPPRKESWGTSSIFQDIDGNKFVLASK